MSPLDMAPRLRPGERWPVLIRSRHMDCWTIGWGRVTRLQPLALRHEVAWSLPG